MVLSVNNDSTYADSATDPSQKLHQQDHDAIHEAINALNAAYDADVAAGFAGSKQAWLEQIGAGGAVDSVNGQTGVVVLDGGDIAIADAGGYFTTDTVEAALQELGAGGGGGGSIAVEEDGVEVVATASRFDFTGDGVTVTDDGSGQVGVAITGAAGGIIAAHSYENASDVVIATTTSTTFADVDATNAAVSFTAPPSGTVVVDIHAYGGANTAGESYRWNLRDGSGDIAGTDMRLQFVASSTNPNYGRYAYRAVVSGLTPSAALTWKMGHALVVAGGSNNGRIWTGPSFGPLMIVVFAVP